MSTLLLFPTFPSCSTWARARPSPLWIGSFQTPFSQYSPLAISCDDWVLIKDNDKMNHAYKPQLVLPVCDWHPLGFNLLWRAQLNGLQPEQLASNAARIAVKCRIEIKDNLKSLTFCALSWSRSMTKSKTFSTLSIGSALGVERRATESGWALGNGEWRTRLRICPRRLLLPVSRATVE